jgi:hypothetical protein
MIHFERKTIHFFLSNFHILKNLSILMPILFLKTIQSTLIHVNIFDEQNFFSFICLFLIWLLAAFRNQSSRLFGAEEKFFDEKKSVTSIFFNWNGYFFERFQQNLLLSLRISHYSIFEQTFSIFRLKWYIETPRITITIAISSGLLFGYVIVINLDFKIELR